MMLGVLFLLFSTHPLDPATGVRGCMAPAGDLDQDGVPDLWVARRPTDDEWIGSYSIRRTSGQVWALSGKDGSVLLDVERKDRKDEFGRSLAFAGDVNGDGIPDVVVGGGNSRTEIGYAQVLSGKDGSVLHEVHSGHEGDEFGFSVDGGRDLDGDGVPDFVVGTNPCYSESGPKPLARIYSGKDGAPILVGPDGQENYVLGFDVPPAKRLYGVGVALLPDLNGDGRAEIALGGRVYSGFDGSQLYHYLPGEWLSGGMDDVTGDSVPDIYLSDVNRYVSIIDSKTGDLVQQWPFGTGYLHSEGYTVTALGDVDGDGKCDLAIGASEAPVIDTEPDAGFVMVVSSTTEEPIYERAAPSHDGYDVSRIGDVDGDGKPDLAVFQRKPKLVEVLSSATWKPIWTKDISQL